MPLNMRGIMQNYVCYLYHIFEYANLSVFIIYFYRHIYISNTIAIAFVNTEIYLVYFMTSL